MASLTSSERLANECTICLDVFKDPRNAGHCGHSFCKGCLEQWVKYHRRGNTFCCPICFTTCLLPQVGVEGLARNYPLAAVLAGRGLGSFSQKSELCIICHEKHDKRTLASRVCCHAACAMFLCESHGHEHAIAHSTHDHEVVAMCPLHKRALSLYCRCCNIPICFVCQASRHSESNHEIVQYKDVVAKKKEHLQQGLADARETIEEHIDSGEMMIHRLRAKVESVECTKRKQLLDKTTKAEHEKDNEHAVITERIEKFKEEVRKLEKVQRDVAKQKQDIVDDRQEQISIIEEEAEDVRQHLQQSSRELQSSRTQLKNVVKRCEELFADNVLSEAFILYLEEAEEQMKILCKAEGKITTALGEISEKYKLLEADAKAEPVFSTKFTDGFLVRNLTFLSEDSLVASIFKGTWKIYYWTIPDPAYREVYSSTDMIYHITDKSKDALVALFKVSAQIRCVNVHGNSVRVIKLQNKVQGIPRCIRFVDERFIISYSSPNQIFVIDTEGTRLRDIELDCDPWRFTFLKPFGRMILVVESKDETLLSAFRFHDDRIDHVMTTRHKMERFKCVDISSGLAGDVVVAGETGDKVSVYQMISRSTDQKGFASRRINLMNTEIETSRLSYPCCSVFGDKLAVGNDTVLKVLKFCH